MSRPAPLARGTGGTLASATLPGGPLAQGRPGSGMPGTGDYW